MELKDCKVGMLVVANHEQMHLARHREEFPIGQTFAIMAVHEDDGIIEVNGINGERFSLLPKRFNPALDPAFFHVGDVVRRKLQYQVANWRYGDDEVIITESFVIGNRLGARLAPREGLDGRIGIRAGGQDIAVWQANKFEFIRHAGVPVIRAKVDGVFEPGDKVEHKDIKGVTYTVKNYFPDTGKVTIVESPGTYDAKSFKHAVPAGIPIAPAPKPKPPEFILPDHDQVLMDKLTKEAGGSVCSYAYKTFPGGERRVDAGAACHAGLGYHGNGQKIQALACNVSHHYNQLPKNIQPFYQQHTEYILNESPWAKYFHKRAIEDVLASGVFMDVDNPHNHVVGACIALRVGHEHTPETVLTVFAKAIELGYSKHVAFVVAHTTSLDNGKLNPLHNNGWHHCINSDHNVKQLGEFFKNGYTREVDGSKTKDGFVRYHVQDVVADNGGGSVSDSYKKAKGAKEGNGQWGAKTIEMEGDWKDSLKALCDVLVPYF